MQHFKGFCSILSILLMLAMVIATQARTISMPRQPKTRKRANFETQTFSLLGLELWAKAHRIWKDVLNTMKKRKPKTSQKWASHAHFNIIKLKTIICGKNGAIAAKVAHQKMCTSATYLPAKFGADRTITTRVIAKTSFSLKHCKVVFLHGSILRNADLPPSIERQSH